MKRPFLAVHDYGMGGLWAYIWAESRKAIETKFEAEVVNELPAWLIGEKPGVASVDIDGPLPAWLPLR